ncbi:gamma-interferon-responsive lysosomal thiol protein-like [Rutidosis leptorrhynchoides]|uniref:gamma-interferon-responsive lysosomal thiol protein-like n=1 Tax=Rutidosis leptorrhynchoides TaxID=125765 RepID=UPI003A9A2391
MFRSNLLLVIVIVSLAANLSTSVSLLSSNEQKVKLALYCEALCPTSASFIINYLYKIIENGLISIVDLELSPYGNAKISANGTIVCQLGEWECMLNTVEACAIQTWPSVSDHFPFVYCIEKLAYENKYTEWETCFEKLNLDPKPVADCYGSGFGYELELQYAQETKMLQPAHTYVPWGVVDGQPLYDDFTEFISYICKAYKGSNVPNACLDVSHPIGAPKNAKPRNDECYKDEENAKSRSTLLEIILAIVASWMPNVGTADSM